MPTKLFRAFGLTTLCLALGALLLPRATRAADFLTEQDATVEAGQTVDGNLYASGDTVTIDGRVEGDLICAGGKILINASGSVGGDVACAGRDIEIRGEVLGDVRAAGYVIRLGEGARVGGEWVAAGFAIELEPESEVAEDLMVAGAQVRSAGTLKRDARVAAAGLEILGEVLGDVDAALGGAADAPQAMPMPWMQPDAGPMPASVKGGLTIGKQGRIGGTLNYRSPEKAELPEGAVAGDVDHALVSPEAAGADVPEPEQAWWLRWILDTLRTGLALFVVGLLLLALAPRLAARAQGLALSELLPSLGWGIGGYFGAFVLMVALALATGLGVVFLSLLTLGQVAKLAFAFSFVCGTLLTFGLYLMGWGGQALVARDLGSRLAASAGAEQGLSAQLLPLAYGALLLALVLALPVPFLGSLLRLLVLAWGLGLALLALRRTMAAQAGAGQGDAGGLTPA